MSVKKLEINNFYFHSIIHGAIQTLDVIDNVIKSGAIKSAESRGEEPRYGCHTKDEICLSMLSENERSKDLVSCFDIYVPKLTSFVIDKRISEKQKIIKPKCVTLNEIFYYPQGTVTNLYDEYRTTCDIPLDYITGISIPYKKLVEDPFCFVPFVVDSVLMSSFNYGIEPNVMSLIKRNEFTLEAKKKREIFLEKYIEDIKKIISEYNLDIPIYNYEESKELILK